MRSQESYSNLLYLANEKSKVEDDYIWIII
jgi:hypothetical protein